MIEWEGCKIPIKKQAELLGVPRSSLYYKPKDPSELELFIKRRIDELFTEYPFMGSRKIRDMLVREGYKVNRKRIQQYMREMGFSAICPGPNTSKRNHQHRIYPYLLRGLAITEPNQVWGIDITYIRMPKGWMYLVAVIDWYSRYVISWELDDNLKSDFVLRAVRNAFEVAKPKILNSDQGSHFTANGYIELVKGVEVSISMDGRGRALDNVFTERFWRTIEYEEVYIKEYQTPREARESIRRYIEFYNNCRPHQALNSKTPAEMYFVSQSTIVAA